MSIGKKIVTGLAIGGAIVGGAVILSKKFAINVADIVVDKLLCKADDDEGEEMKDLDFDDII